MLNLPRPSSLFSGVRTVYALLLLPLLPVLLTAQEDDDLSDNLELLSSYDPKIAPSFNYNDIWGYVADGREYAIMGVKNGTYVIDVTDPAAPVEIGFVEGAISVWRDIKTYDTYAYVTHDANENGFTATGIQIIDLSNLPESIELVTTFSEDMPNGVAHNIYIDNNIAYVAGARNNDQLIILDLSNPTEPTIIDKLSEPYWHDVVVNNGMVFGSALDEGIHLMDATDPSDLKEISLTGYPGNFTHNMWPTADNQYIVVTDERNGAPLRFWDISDPLEPRQVAQFEIGGNAVAHNAHVLGDYAYVSYYYDGLKIFDISRREAPVEVAHYDTYADDNFNRARGFNGAWGVYPNLPSGNILVSDMKYGLHVLRFNNVGAAYLGGTVTSEDESEPIVDVEVSLVDQPVYSGTSVANSNAQGQYVIGNKPGLHKMRFFKYGFEPLIIDEVMFSSEREETLNVELRRIPTGPAVLRVVDRFGTPIPSVAVSVKSNTFDFNFEASSDGRGEVRRTLLYDNYTVEVSAWGFLPVSMNFDIEQSDISTIDFVVERGYYESFWPAEGWQRYDEADSGDTWQLVQANNQEFDNFLPKVDFQDREFGIYMWARAQRDAAPLTSPQFDLTNIAEPYLSFRRWYNAPEYLRNAEADDSLQVWISNDLGESWSLLVSYADVQDEAWTEVKLPLEGSIEFTDQMLLRIDLVEGDRENRVNIRVRRPAYAGIDEFYIVAADVISSVEDAELESQDLSQDLSQNPGLAASGHKLLNIYPNPATHSVEVRLQAAAQPVENFLRVSDVRGQVMLQKRIAATNAGTVVFSVQDWPAGVYFVKLGSGNASQQTSVLHVRR